jgi:hypothetical protein
LNASEFESLPIARARESEELFESLLSDVDGTGTPLFVFGDVEEVSAEILFGGTIRGVAEKLGKLSKHSEVGLLSSFRLAVKLEVLLEADSDR